jgi:hypothetical protein
VTPGEVAEPLVVPGDDPGKISKARTPLRLRYEVAYVDRSQDARLVGPRRERSRELIEPRVRPEDTSFVAPHVPNLGTQAAFG